LANIGYLGWIFAGEMPCAPSLFLGEKSTLTFFPQKRLLLSFFFFKEVFMPKHRYALA
jgi:hypothetical protein